MSGKIAIAGAGICGSYMYRLLTNAGYDIDIYDKIDNTRCKISSCAWGTTERIFEYLDEIEVDFNKYILHNSKQIKLGNKYYSWNHFSFDKPQLISDLLKGAHIYSGKIDFNRYTRVIDATGVDRAYLPKIMDDLIVPTFQYRIKTENELPFEMIPLKGDIGYRWVFPLGNNEYHIGGGFLKTDITNIDLLENLNVVKLCSCTGKIRLSSPYYSKPFSIGNVVGVGESIGVVGPLGGEGIVPGFESCDLLFNNWDNLSQYESKILKTFKWMKKERELQNKLMVGGKLSIFDVLRLIKSANMAGLKLNIKTACKLLKPI